MPNESDLWKKSRFTSMGFRICYGFAEDEWNNDFKLKFPDLTPEENTERNQRLDKHFREIKFWDEMPKFSGFKYEQGDSILLMHREGTTWKGLKRPPNIKKKIVRVEAIHKQDYQIPNIGDNHLPDQFKIAFMRSGFGKPEYIVHPDRVIWAKNHNLDYEEYSGMSALQPCFGTLTILDMILRAVGDVCHRWGPGLPAISIRQGNEQILDKIRNWIGDPTSQSWFLFPENWISDIKMLGVQGTTLDMKELWELCLDDVIIKTEIPYGILTGKEVSIQGDEVTNQQYYNTLDKAHSNEETWIHTYFELDPTVQEIIGEDYYEIDWALRLVMSEDDKIQLQTKKSTLAQLQASITTLNENREMQGYKRIEDVVEHKEVYKKMFDMTPEELGDVLTILVPMVYTVNNPMQMGMMGQGGAGQKLAQGKRPDGSDNSAKDGGFQLSQRNAENQIARQIADSVLTYHTMFGDSKTSKLLGVGKDYTRYKIVPKLRLVVKESE